MLVVLYVLLRSALAPLVLVAVTVLSALAALGLGGWASVHVFGFPALDNTAPLFAFLFLVALGVDYTIFLVTRAREETPAHGTRDGIVRAVSATGAVITSAGIVLAAVFCVLGVLPLIVLTQVGIIVGLGILLDTFVVRTVIIPALFTLIGPRIWWPALRDEATVRQVEGHQVDTVLGRVRVQVRGSGEAMMFWPSLLMTGDMWAAQADHFGTEHQVILVDPPGFGESQKLTAPFTFDDCARCIVDILDGLGVQRTHFVGNSWGGMIGGTFAADVPRSHRQRGVDELHRVACGHTAEDRVRLPVAHGRTARRNPAAADPFGAQGVPRPDDVHHPARCRGVRARHGAARRRSVRVAGRFAAWCRPGRTSARC